MGEEVLDLELYQAVDPAADKVDSLHGLHFKANKLLILALEFPDLPKLLIELLMVRVQDSGLEGQSRASYGEDTDRQ